MKPKKFKRKLTLKKKTIAHLSIAEMIKLNGGGRTDWWPSICIKPCN